MPVGRGGLRERAAAERRKSDACAVIVFNDGTAETIPAKELTYARIYRRAFKGPPLLGYLTVRGFVEPKGVDK